MISVNFLKLNCPSFGNMYVHHGIINLTCIVVVVDSRCVCLGVAGGSQYTTSCEPPCGLAILLGRPVPHQSREIIIYIHVLATCSQWLSYTTLDTRV